MTLKLILILSLVVLVLMIVCYFLIKALYIANKRESTLEHTISDLEQVLESRKLTEKKKTEIRNEYNNKESDIINGNNNDSSLPIDSEESHNHRFSEPCGTSCPAYNRK